MCVQAFLVFCLFCFLLTVGCCIPPPPTPPTAIGSSVNINLMIVNVGTEILPAVVLFVHVSSSLFHCLLIIYLCLCVQKTSTSCARTLFLCVVTDGRQNQAELDIIIFLFSLNFLHNLYKAKCTVMT